MHPTSECLKIYTYTFAFTAQNLVHHRYRNRDSFDRYFCDDLVISLDKKVQLNFHLLFITPCIIISNRGIYCIIQFFSHLSATAKHFFTFCTTTLTTRHKRAKQMKHIIISRLLLLVHRLLFYVSSLEAKKLFFKLL